MNAKFGLFDFFESQSVEVAATANIVFDTNDETDLNLIITNNSVVSVKWTETKRGRGAKKSAKVYKAKLLKVHGTF